MAKQGDAHQVRNYPSGKTTSTRPLAPQEADAPEGRIVLPSIQLAEEGA
ncbi:hypothetical protein PZH32_07560 [Adlercreutzia equolifaciens]|nr:hypothetical protein [Adlercreutzia equolifaciens]MDE8702821.1 hypothetical protein [Adlercreutzia equolifaciens]